MTSNTQKEIERLRKLVVEWRKFESDPAVGANTKKIARAEITRLEREQQALYDKLDKKGQR